jgi:hypothetical protein
MANWNTTTGTLAVGAFRLWAQYWLFSAVKSSGAVSPLMRASPSKIPVRMPGAAARYSTCTVTFQRGMPSDRAASRMTSGTRRSVSSVVRTTTGSTISASAMPPAQPEK